MFFKIAKYAIILEICIVILSLSLDETNHPAVSDLPPSTALVKEIPPIRKLIPIVKIPFSVMDTLKAVENASPLAKCIVKHEVGGGTKKYPPWYPYAIGGAGELGVVQLHPRGKLPEFYKMGFTDPYNPYQALTYLEDALKRGQKYHWSPVVTGLCR